MKVKELQKDRKLVVELKRAVQQKIEARESILQIILLKDQVMLLVHITDHQHVQVTEVQMFLNLQEIVNQLHKVILLHQEVLREIVHLQGQVIVAIQVHHQDHQ